MISDNMLAALPPFLRVLLATDGTVTRSLEAYFWELIDVDVLTHAMAVSDRSYPQIGIDRGQAVLQRRVILRGRSTGIPYVFAQSIICSERISASMRADLVEGRQGIGEVLIATKQRTFREILGVQRTEAGGWASYLEVDVKANLLVRQYTISNEQEPAIHIEEAFPVCRYEHRIDR